MVTKPSTAINVRNIRKSYSLENIIIVARAIDTIVIIDPGIWMFAPRGMTKADISALTPFFSAHFRFTGMDAALDCVPSAVA